MSRPSGWSRVATNFFKFLKKDWSEKVYVGKDTQGISYYELHGTRKNVSRGFEPPFDNLNSKPGVEWLSWIKGTRRFPPNEQELLSNESRQQAQLEQNDAMEKFSPKVGSTGPPAGGPTAGPKIYPQYDDFEKAPGYNPDKIKDKS
ncbi:unnamed protein product, partial [Mesorhabditis belari]|uniref:NADH dehydrogenase [ubiquinone] 1 alpha subcomplex subunit 12 n=1 Tax=Mesorhabditis belari TaxID=2138241 RepID=A0AAF3EQM4_9BILA